MIPIEQTPTGMLIFLNCGCSAWRGISHPTGAAALVEVIQPCKAHEHDHVRFRAVPKGEAISPWVRTPLHLDPARAR